MAYVIIDSTEDLYAKTGGGPRTSWAGMNKEGKIYNRYLVIGAFGNINHIDSGKRPLTMTVNGGLTIKGLTQAPSGVRTSDLVIDPGTGRIYHQ